MKKRKLEDVGIRQGGFLLKFGFIGEKERGTQRTFLKKSD